MSVIFEQIQKAYDRAGGQNMAALRDATRSSLPRDLASFRDQQERRDYLSRVVEVPSEVDKVFERVINGNELQDVNYLSRGKKAARAIGRVAIRQANGRLKGFGTGFLVAPSVLITNNHVLDSREAANRSEFELDYERDDDGSELMKSVFSLDPAKLFFTSAELDFSVVAVASKAGDTGKLLADYGFLPLVAATGKAIEGEWLTIIQHPSGGLKQICVRENRLIKKAPDVIWYSTDTSGGSSGSPVFNNDWVVVALHHCGIPETKDGLVQTMSGQNFDPAIHRDEEIKWVANEGIRVSRIVETLQASAGDAPLLQPIFSATPELAVEGARFGPSAQLATAAAQSEIPFSISPSLSTGLHPPFQSQLMSANHSLSGRQLNLTVSFDAGGNPVVTRVSEASSASEIGAAFPEKTKVKKKVKPAAKVSFTFDKDYSTRAGFDENFLEVKGGKGKHKVYLPVLGEDLQSKVVTLKNSTDHVLRYTNMSLVMHTDRRFAIYSAANVDFGHRVPKLKSKRVWRFDDRIPREKQVGNDAYLGNQFDVGHLTRQEDMEYGKDIPAALQSTADTCHWTNVTPQHAKFNRTTEWWQGIERHILERSITEEGKSLTDPSKGFPAQIFTGPILSEFDPVFPELPGLQIPVLFWKVAVGVASNGKLFAAAYLLDQRPAIQRYGLKEAAVVLPFAPYKKFQLPLAELEEMTQLKFYCGPVDPHGPKIAGAKFTLLSDFDPLKDGVSPELDADQDGDDDRNENTGSGGGGGMWPKTPTGWIDLDRTDTFLG